ncbi:hypothetical protein F5Y15DRAFT_193628 [Xylariaceae sp. FL0016]|nr:hypothetical protein F5Y15DRAFT_193628 [Xylariaceae sp. FL0016]
MSNSNSSGVPNTSRHVRSRTQSVSSDRPSSFGTHGLMSPPLSVTPEAAFIAASAASQIVTNDHDSHSDTWYDQMGLETSGETAMVSNAALQLANNFVDQLLFNIIAVAKSTSLSALRPAVSEVLKPKLAKDAINQADEELREYLGGGEIEDLSQTPTMESSRDWDLELVWKRTRLRCMVYSSLGDMEEEDEDYYMEQEHLHGENDDFRSDLVSPAVAIFLTSILEFMGEQVLVVAGQAAFTRLRIRYEKDFKEGTRSPGDFSERIVVEDFDMERVALDRTLGRLWRAWKKKMRSPLEPNYSRPFSRSSTAGSGFSHQRGESSATDLVPSIPVAKNASAGDETPEETGEETQRINAEESDPANLPLPDSDDEATYSDEEESEDEDDLPVRPKSWVISSQTRLDLLPLRPLQRASSLPARKRRRYVSPPDVPSESDETPEAAQNDTPAPVENVEESHKDQETEGEKDAKPSGLIATLASGAAAVGSAAAAGLAAVATGHAPQTEVEEATKAEGEIEEFTEEPEIMTSSRVSIGGRSSPAISEAGRPPSIVQTRSNSVRSLRVIDVQGPRSPSISSRPGSIDGQEPLSNINRSASISREGSVSRTPPILEEFDSAGPPAGISKRHAVVVPSPTEPSRDTPTALTAPPRTRSPPKSVPSPVTSQPPPPPQQTTQTKITILNNTAAQPPEERPDPPQKLPGTLRSPPMPTLPERSTSRPAHAQTQQNVTPAPRGPPESPKQGRIVLSESPSSAASASNKLKPTRTSEDSSSVRPADMARNFEELIQSNETLQYTLTPENMRNIDSTSQHNGSPKATHKTWKGEDGKSTDRSRSSSIKRSVSVTKATGLNSHPPTDVPASGKLSGSVPHAPPQAPSKGRPGAISQARDARVPRESINDFAEFIRSTGPPGDNRVPSNRANASNATIVRNITGPTISPAKSSMDSRRTSNSTRARLQARDATVTAANESSDLIDFIRRGPPTSHSNNPRIPRNVAPFRNTMDSEQMHMTGAVGGKAVDAVLPNVRNSQASTNMTESSAPSSMNSQSALLNKANKMPQYSSNNFDDDDLMPKRTRRRVKDPYAIDFSDEEEEDDFDLTPKPKPKQKQEESLIDFLNNYPPPPDPTPQPIAMPKKKSSAPNLIARLRGAGSGNSNSNGSAGPGFGRRSSVSAENRGPSRGTNTSRNHTPIVVPSGVDHYGTDYKSQARMPPRNTTAGRVAMKKFEPRDAHSTASRGTADLASFLRDSEPPPSTMATLPSPPETQNSGSFSRMFERRKKSTAY